MADWFRSYHGAPVDPKWGAIARRASVARVLVVALAWLLLDVASRSRPRGSIAGAQIDEIAVQLDCQPGDVEAVMAAMREPDARGRARFIGPDEMIRGWGDRQPTREREGGADLLSPLSSGANPETQTGGANPPAGASPANTAAAMPRRRAIRQPNTQDVGVGFHADTQKTTSNHVATSDSQRRAIGSQSPPLPPPAPPPTTPRKESLYKTPIPSLSPGDAVDAVRLAVWRAAKRSEDWIATRLVSTSREGIAEAQAWLGLGLSVDDIGVVASEVFAKSQASIGKPFRYVADAVMRRAAEKTAQGGDGVAVVADLWGERVDRFRRSGLWLPMWGAPPGDADCAAPKSILERYGYSPQPQERP